MRELVPFLQLYKKHWGGLTLGMILALLTTLSSIGLLTLSGWFIAASAMAGILAVTNFNFMLPAAGVRGFSISRTAGRWAERVVSHNATFKLLADLRIYFFNKLAPLVPGQATNIRDADLLNRLIADVNAMDHLYLRLVSPLLVGTFSILGISGFLSWFSPYLGLTLGGILFLLMFSLPVIFYRLGKPHGIEITHAKSDFRVSFLDWLNGNAELTIFGAEKRFKARGADAENTLLKAQRKMADITGLSSTVLIAANGLTLVLMLWLAADAVAGQPASPLIAMVAFATMASFELMTPIAGAFQYLSQTLTSAHRLNHILNAKPDVAFLPDGHQAVAKGKITFKKVTFQYDESNKNALTSVSLSISAGENIALLGRTGCGKSTMLQLITRAWDPSQGEILLDDIALPQWQESSLRASISVVTQRVDILNGTLRNNLTIASPHATDETLSTVLEKVGLTSLLKGNGLDAWLGDGGRILSGGEKRRIGVARALLHNAPILLLDEPTEGLDVKSEQMILALLLEHAKDKTLLFISHRLVGLTNMDKILLMDSGEIVEEGDHKSLLAQGGRYAELFNQIL